MQAKLELTGVHARIDKLLEIESRYPVDSWKVNDIHIWPVIRTRLYIEMAIEELQVRYDKNVVATTKSEEKQKTSSRFGNYVQRMQNGLIALYYEIRPMKKSEALFVTPASYNDQFEGKWYHKFFDPIRLSHARYHEAPILEIGKSRSGQIRNAIHLSEFERLVQHFDRKHRSQLLIVHLEGFEEFMSEVSSFTEVTKRLNRRSISEAYYAIKKYEDLFHLLIRKMGLREVYGICYYLDSFVLMGMNVAAHKAGIKSFDVQHGGQGPVHIGYCKYYRLPDSGYYEVMPTTFWCWDDASKYEIDKWATMPNSKHQVIVGGQPWLNFIKEKIVAKKTTEKTILVTLQPHGELIPEVILKTISKADSGVKWILRLHPRTMSRKEELQKILSDHKVLDFIHQATWDMPSLPESIAMSSVHISRTSGSVIEASLMNIPNIIIDPVGADLYKDLIEKGKAFNASHLDSEGLGTLIQRVLLGENR